MVATTEAHSQQWWDTNARKARVDRATLEKEIAYEQDKLAARDWGIAQYNRGRPLNEIVPVLRLKYYRAWRKFIR